MKLTDKPTLNPRWVISLSGKEYPTWPGILDLAHQLGLESIETDLVQIPNADNQETAIVKATARLKDGRHCAEYGDANPRNTSARVATALLRMAATRAKGRALRDLCNVGQVMLEELPEEEAVALARSSAANQAAPPVRSGGVSRTEPAAAAPGFEPVCEIDGKTYQRLDLVRTCLLDQETARQHGIVIEGEALEPATATNAQLIAYGRLLRPKLRAAKAISEGAKVGPKKAEVTT